MSLLLNNGTIPNELRVKTGFGFDDSVSIGDYELSMDDFCETVTYVLMNTDLKENDPRLKLLETIKKLQVMPGYMSNKTRLNIPI